MQIYLKVYKFVIIIASLLLTWIGTHSKEELIMCTLLFEELSMKWLETATIGVSYSWEKALKSMVGHLNDHFKGVTIDAIKPADMALLIKDLSKKNPNTNKPASKKTLKTLNQTAYRIFDYAIENDYLSKNPAEKSQKRIPKTAPTKIVEPLSDTQQSYIMDFENPTKIAVVIMMFMGLRIGELLALEWKDFDFDDLTVFINKSCSRVSSNYYTVKPGTKNGKNRKIAIPRSIVDYLETQRLRSVNSLVMPNKSGSLHTVSTWKREWKTYQNNLNYYVYSQKCMQKGIQPKNKYCPTGIPDMGVTFNAHQLRHTYATMLYKSNVDVLTAKELLGHSDVKTTLGIYTHLDEKYKKINIIKFDNYIQAELLKASSL